MLFFELVGPETLSNAIALNSGLFNATRVLGPALAGVCLSLFGATGCFALNGVSFMAAIAAILSIRLKPRPRAHHDESCGFGVILGGLHHLREDRRLLLQFVLVAYFGVIGMGYEAMIPAFAARVVHTGVRGYTTLLACGGIGATVGALVIASLGGVRRKERLTLTGMIIFGASLACAACIPVWLPANSPQVAKARMRFNLSSQCRFRCRALLFLVDDAHPDQRARPFAWTDDGYLDDRLFGLCPTGRTLDRKGCRIVWSCDRHGNVGGDLHHHSDPRSGVESARGAAARRGVAGCRQRS